MVTIRHVTRDEMLRRLENELKEERMTVEEFRAEGEADTLTDANLRDLWLHYRPLLFDEWPSEHSEPSPGTSFGVTKPPTFSSTQRAHPRRKEMATIRVVTRDELLQELKESLEEERMTVEEFRAEGEADMLTDANLRDLWLEYRPLLFDE